ncbi:MAG: DNA-directed DNA polymerase, partial [Candidatus Woesearchaeota archaeon]
HYNISLDIGADYSEITESRYAVAITGMLHIDLARFIALTRTEDTLQAVTNELLDIKTEQAETADLTAMDREKLSKLAGSALRDSELIYKLLGFYYTTILELSKLSGMTAFDIVRRGTSAIVENYLMARAGEFGEIIPNKPTKEEIGRREGETFEGAFVLAPNPGLYENVAVFDFKSLYPSIIVTYNISPTTMGCECCTTQFCQKRKGFIPAVLEELIARRQRILEILKENKDKQLEAREQSLKLLSNSFYGYLGFSAARWYSAECARIITGHGREVIQKIIEQAKNAGFDVVYSDTDSIFVLPNSKEKSGAADFLNNVNFSLPKPMELELEDIYPRALFVGLKVGEEGAKKKYALLTSKGTVKIKGFAAVKRNYSVIARDVQRTVLQIILAEKNPEKAADFVRYIVDELKNKRIPLDKVVIYTQLQKKLDEYETITPYVAVARKLKQDGMDVSPGYLVRYVITEHGEKISDSARLPEETKQSEYDSDYYVHNQVVPAVEKIFDVFGISTDDLLEKDQSKLSKFF